MTIATAWTCRGQEVHTFDEVTQSIVRGARDVSSTVTWVRSLTNCTKSEPHTGLLYSDKIPVQVSSMLTLVPHQPATTTSRDKRGAGTETCVDKSLSLVNNRAFCQKWALNVKNTNADRTEWHPGAKWVKRTMWCGCNIHKDMYIAPLMRLEMSVTMWTQWQKEREVIQTYQGVRNKDETKHSL